MEPRKFFPYQLAAARWLYRRKQGALFAGVGSGKTTIIAHVINRLLDEVVIRRVLLVAPLAVCKSVWRQECEEWSSLHGLTFSLVVGSPAQRLKALEQEADIYLINYDTLSWLLNLDPMPEFDALVLDESTFVQSASSLRFKGKVQKTKNKNNTITRKKIFGLKDKLAKFEYRFALTATPKPSKYLGLWSQIYCLDMGKRLEKNITAFKRKYYYKYGPEHYHIKIRDKDAEKEIRDKIRDICYHIPRSEISKNLPKVVIRNYYVDLPKKAQKLYNTLDKEFIAEVESNIISIDNVAVRSSKLHQVCQGSVYDDDKAVVNIHNEKIEMLDAIVNGLGDRNAICVYQFKHDLNRLLRWYNAPIIRSTLPDKKHGALVKAWNDGKHPIVYGHGKSFGHGLNLQGGGFDIILFGLTWSLDMYQQMIGRIRRTGQKNDTVFVHRIITRNSVEDELMAPRLRERAQSQKEFVNSFARYANKRRC